jgi:DNA gyrase subunit A
MSGEQKLKEGDSILQQIESVNSADLLFFTNRCTVYKAKASDFSDTKASVLGDYLPAQLGMEEGEVPIYMAVTTDYKGYMLFFFENGKVAKVDLASYQTKTNRKKLVNAYSDKSPVVACAQIEEDCEFLLTSSKGKVLLIHSGAIASKSTRSTQGVSAMTLKRGAVLSKAQKYEEGMLTKPDRYRKKIPSSGTVLSEEEQGEQLTLS